MIAWKRTMWILWVGVLLCSSSYTMAVPFLPLFLHELGVSDQSVNLWAGIVHSSAFLIGAIMAPLWGSVADKYGRRKMVIRAGLCLAIIYALIAFVRNPIELIIVRLLHGLVGGFVPASMAIVASIAPQEKTGWSIGMMQAGVMSGTILGPLFGGLLASTFGQRMSFIAAGVIIFIATLAVIFWVQEVKTETTAKRSNVWKDLLYVFKIRLLMHMLLLLVLFQLAINMIQPLLTLHIAHLQGSVEDAVLTSGLVFALLGIAGIIASPFWGKVGAKHTYERVLFFCLVSSGIVVATQFFISNLWVFATVQFLFGLFIAGVVPAVNTLMVQKTSSDFRGRSFGLTASANQLGSMIGPLIGGALGYFLSIHWIFITTGLFLIVGALYSRTLTHTLPEEQEVVQRKKESSSGKVVREG